MFEALTGRLSSILSGLVKPGRLTESNMDEGLERLRAALLEADVAFSVVRDLLARVREKAVGTEILSSVSAGEMLVKLFHDELVALMTAEGPEQAFVLGRPHVVLLAGLQGSGKTTTAAKLAVYLRDQRGRKPLLVAADVQRPAAIDQLQQLGAGHDLPVFHLPGAVPEEIAERALAEARATGRDTVLIDTAGRLHVDEELMAELRRVAGRARPDTTYLVCDAMTGQDAVRSAAAFAASLPLDGVILTKLDGDTRGGAAISVRHVTGAPVAFVGLGEKVGDLQPFHADRMVGRILGMGDVVGLVEKAQAAVDEEAAEEQVERMLRDQFTLEDFLKQLGAMKKMGSLKDIMGHLPGMPAGFDPSQLDERALDRTQAVVLSMTPVERRRPEVIDAGRRRRIARGSGTSEKAVSDLLRQFEQMKKVMKAFQQQGLLSRLASRFTGKVAGGMPDMDSLLAGGASGQNTVSPRLAAGRPGNDERRKARKAERQRKKQARRRR